MIPVDPDTKTTLVLNKNYQSSGRLFSAKATIRHLINGRVKGIDASGNAVSWAEEGSSTNWNDLTIELFPDQPCLRSAPDPISDRDRQWPVPTIVVCTYHWGYHGRRGSTVSLKSIYAIYKGICQYCLRKIPYSDATKDHVFPKSMGGSNDDFNFVLACRSCNSEKESIYPYYDVNGNEVKPRGILNYLMGLPHGVNVRDEWKPYLFIT